MLQRFKVTHLIVHFGLQCIFFNVVHNHPFIIGTDYVAEKDIVLVFLCMQHVFVVERPHGIKTESKINETFYC